MTSTDTTPVTPVVYPFPHEPGRGVFTADPSLDETYLGDHMWDRDDGWLPISQEPTFQFPLTNELEPVPVNEPAFPCIRTAFVLDGTATGISSTVPAINGMLEFGPVANAGTGASLAVGAAGRGPAGGPAGDPGDLMVLDLLVGAGAPAGDITLDFEGAVVPVLDSTLTTISTDPGPSQQSLTTNSITITVGDAGCNDADVAPPFGILDLADISTFVAAFTVMDPLADIADSGVLDLTDISLFVAAFAAGCP